MAKTRIISSFLNYTPSATSTNADFPASNLALSTHPFRPWKAIVATGIVDVTLDFGSALNGLAANPGIFLFPVNFTSAKIQGNSTLSWSSPPWDQAVMLAKDRYTGRYKGFWRLADLSASAFAYRYLNVRILSQTPIDGLPYRIGTIVVGQITELTSAQHIPIGRRREDPAIVIETLDGGREILEMGESVLTLTMPRKLYSQTEVNEQLDIDGLGVGSPFVLWDSGLNAPEGSWLVRRAEPSDLQHQWTTFHEGRWALREVV